MPELTEPDPISADRRRSRHKSRLPADAVCVLCGLSNLDTLSPVPITLLEEHHVLGRAASATTTVPLCRNCHAVQTAAQHDHKALPQTGRYRTEDTLIERIARALRSLGLFVHELAHALVSYADQLQDFAGSLDLALPGWRTEGWAA